MSAADLLRLHRCRRWNDRLHGTERGSGWFLYTDPLPPVCEFPVGLTDRDDEYTNYLNYAAVMGRVRARYALRDPRFALWPNHGSARRLTAPLGEIEVIGGKHSNFLLLANPPTSCPDLLWDESRLASDFFRDNGLGT